MSIDQKSVDQHIVNFQNQLEASTVRGNMQPVDPEREAEAARDVDTVNMVRQVTSRIDAIQGRLKETSGFDPKTGVPNYVVPINDRRRHALEIELHHLRSSVLPYTQSRMADIEARKAQLETPEQRLQAEADRQQRLIAAAEKRAEEIEIENMARRLLSQRKHVGSA